MSDDVGGGGPAISDAAEQDKIGKQLLGDLLEDAKIVAVYAERAGLLKSTALPHAISEVEKLQSPTWGEASVVALQSELNATLRDLTPTTIHDLKGPHAPFAGRQSPLYSFLFLTFWGAMIILVAFGTVSHNHGLSIVNSLEQLQANRTGQRIEELVRTVVSSTKTLDNILSSPEVPSSGQADAEVTADFAITSTFLANLDEAKALDEQTQIAVDSAKQYIRENVLGTFLLSPYSTLAWLFGAKPESVSQIPIQICADEHQRHIAESYMREEFGATQMAEAIRYNDVEGLSLTCMSGFGFHLRDYPKLQHYITHIKLILNLYGLWLLPALYGALGAAMYHLRRALNPNLPTPSVLRTVNRTIMGSFAGIVIAWFWAPAAQANAESVNVGFNLFVVAFVVGYSIDLFFNFLDRILVTAANSISRLGTVEK